MNTGLLSKLSDEISELAQSVTPTVVTLEITSPSGKSSASGFFMGEGGYIITNAHVFHGTSNEILITMADGSTYQGDFIGSDEDTDIGVIHADIDSPPLAEQGDSDRLRIGEIVMAVGSPYSFTTTVTMGIVSATGRRLESKNQKPMSGIIQTDAAINPGSSGGPMFNAKGEVIGVNTAIIRDAQGLGFAIPINTAQKVAKILIAEGRVNRPILGISICDDDDGVVIDDIEEGFSADLAGLQVGDVLTEINELVIKNTDDAYRLISDLAGQTNASITILRKDNPTPIIFAMELIYAE